MHGKRREEKRSKALFPLLPAREKLSAGGGPKVSI